MYGETEAYMNMLGSNQNCQLALGITATGYFYKFRNDMLNNVIEITRWEGGSEVMVLYQTADHKPANNHIWAQMQLDTSGGTKLTLWFSPDGVTWTQYAQVVDSKTFPTSSYIGIRLFQNGQVDDFGGGALGVSAQAAPAVATANALPASSQKSFSSQAAAATATALSPAGMSKMAAAAGVAAAVALALGGASEMAAKAAPPAVATSSAVAAVGHTDIPVYPPIPPPQPPPPAPPPDPRDVPAQDGPFTYILYNSMLPLAWADEFTGWPMLNFFKSLSYIVHEPYALAVDPGWELIINVDEVPSKFLNWLAQLVGIPTPTFINLSNPAKRAMIKDAPGWKRGTRASMIKAAQETLIGNKTVILYERYDPNFAGQDRAYHLTFITYQSETPDQNATLAALVAAKPGGLQLTLLSRAGQIWQWLRDHYPPTTQRLWSNAKADYADWEHARDVTYY